MLGGLRVGLHILAKRKISFPTGIQTPNCPANSTHQTHHTTWTPILLLAFQKFLETNKHFTLKINTVFVTVSSARPYYTSTVIPEQSSDLHPQ